jgi:uncharacterized RDD family membrane protein YckC
MSNNPATAHPTVQRRLISMVYEMLLGFAVLFLPLLIFEIVTHASHTPLIEHMRQALAFVVLGIYFIHQWVRDGQTLAMKTWRMKLVRSDHEHVSLRAATTRYVLSWMWVLPALVVCLAFDLHRWQALGAVGVGILLWSMTAFLDRNRQFLHDKLSGTRLIQLPPPQKKKKAAVS